LGSVSTHAGHDKRGAGRCVAAGGQRDEVLRGISAAALAIFDRYPTPATLNADIWMEARRQLEHDLTLIGLHGIKRVMDIPIRYVDRYVASMPIHEKLRTKDAPTIHNYLRTNCATCTSKNKQR
jgi:hypothetical protein